MVDLISNLVDETRSRGKQREKLTLVVGVQVREDILGRRNPSSSERLPRTSLYETEREGGELEAEVRKGTKKRGRTK